ncbi:MAG: hypothetical protein K1X47_03260 [Cyclobacteriaceae bacterium]|nr:hypothetical protein [Cyclobacteriaceae bacterium]
MKIVEVHSAAQRKEFLLFPVRLYEQDVQWIRPLDKDIEAVFDPERNRAFRNGKCIRWLLLDEKGTTIGRVAAFVDHKHANKGNDQPTGGMGFYECIDDEKAAFMLFDQCKQWLQQQGMEAMDGPVNFGNRDRWWGLQVDGFDRQPNYLCNHHKRYYQRQFEAYGFQVYFYQLTFGRLIKPPLIGRIQEKARLVEADPDYHFLFLPRSRWKELPELIRSIYNRAWANRGEIPELTSVQAAHMVKQMKPIMDEKLLWFGFYKNDPIAFFLSLPEVNQIFKHVRGRMDLIGKLIFLWHSWRKTNRKAFGVLFGIVPEHQGKGVDGGIIENFRKLVQENYLRYEEYELNWIGDFNTKMIRVCEQIDSSVVKKHATYRKLFNEQAIFRRYPIK